MAGKRVATSDLNHGNWDAEDAPEESGAFVRAPDEVLQKRVIRTAKRRAPISSTGESGAKSAFGSFVSFKKPSGSSSTSFAFLNNTTAPNTDASTVNGVSNISSIFTQPSNVSSSSAIKKSENKTSHNDKDNEYYAKLKGLNESVSNWIKQHVDTNPLINLKPIFKDYERYFDELECGRTNVGKMTEESSAFKKELNSFVFKTTNDAKKDDEQIEKSAQFKFTENKNVKDDNIATTASATFIYGSAPTTINASLFSFGSTTTTSSASTGFSFGNSSSSKPFTFTNVATQQSQSNSEQPNEEQEDDQPPKVEFTPVVEQGHTYNVKCKVFVKNQDSFKDRGVGTLYLKPVADSEKTQLIVRADTNLGNLLCNFILSQGIPTKRMGKKDVMLVCLPTPESKPPAVPILLRVKSPEQADELLAALEKHKK